MSTKKNTTAASLRAELAKRKVTRRELAKRMGVSYDYVCRILRGDNKAPLRRMQIADLLRDRQDDLRGIA